MSVFDGRYDELQKKQDTLHKEDSKLRHEKVMNSLVMHVALTIPIYICTCMLIMSLCMYIHVCVLWVFLIILCVNFSCFRIS